MPCSYSCKLDLVTQIILEVVEVDVVEVLNETIHVRLLLVVLNKFHLTESRTANLNTVMLFFLFCGLNRGNERKKAYAFSVPPNKHTTMEIKAQQPRQPHGQSSGRES